MKKRISQKISKFTRKEIEQLFLVGTVFYKSKELVLLTAPCQFVQKKPTDSQSHPQEKNFGKIQSLMFKKKPKNI